MSISIDKAWYYVFNRISLRFSLKLTWSDVNVTSKPNFFKYTFIFFFYFYQKGIAILSFVI